MEMKKITTILVLLIILTGSGWGVAIYLKSRSAKPVPADRIAVKSDGDQTTSALNCASSTDAKARENCFSKIAAIIDDASADNCKSLSSESDRTACEQGRAVRDAIASSTAGIAECKKLEKQAEIDVCEEQVFINMAITKRDPKKCNLIKNLKDKEMCLNFFKTAVK